MDPLDNKEAVKYKLGVINRNLSALYKDVTNKGTRHSHTIASEDIGSALETPGADAQHAFQIAESYFKAVESKYCSIVDDRDIRNLLEKVGPKIKNIRGVVHPVHNLEQTVIQSSLLMFFIAGLFFLIPKITGGVVGASKSSTNVIGVALVLVGIVGFFIYRLSEK